VRKEPNNKSQIPNKETQKRKIKKREFEILIGVTNTKNVLIYYF